MVYFYREDIQMAKQSVRSRRAYAMALPDALMFYGIPALLVACVISGVWVLAWLICRAVREKKKRKGEEQE